MPAIALPERRADTQTVSHGCELEDLRDEHADYSTILLAPHQLPNGTTFGS